MQQEAFLRAFAAAEPTDDLKALMAVGKKVASK